MNLSQIARLQALKKHLETFRKNHPKFPSFLNAVSHNALEEGTVIEISVTSPSDKNYVTNIKLRQDDLDFLRRTAVSEFQIIISRRNGPHISKNRKRQKAHSGFLFYLFYLFRYFQIFIPFLDKLIREILI